jgi:predicted DNA-binding protein
MANKYWGDFSVKIENDGRDKLELLKQAIEKGLNSPTIEDFNFDKHLVEFKKKLQNKKNTRKEF